MSDDRPLTALGIRMLRRWPPEIQEVPEFRAIAHASARMVEYVDSLVALVRAQYSPRQATISLREWEAVFVAPIDPPGQTDEQRQTTVVAYLRRLRGVPYGITWGEKVGLLVGPTFTPFEHDPNDLTSPPAYVVRVTIPFAPGSERYIQLLASLREFTPAHEDIQLVYDADGFILDLSLMDLEEL